MASDEPGAVHIRISNAEPADIKLPSYNPPTINVRQLVGLSSHRPICPATVFLLDGSIERLMLLAAAFGMPSWRDQQSMLDCAPHFVLVGVHFLDHHTIKYAVDDAVSVLEGN
jgi:hypothetical protein